MEHELKTDPLVFDAVKEGRKTFEIRKNDRDYHVGDTLFLRKTHFTGVEMAANTDDMPLIYTGDELRTVITHILHGPIYGLMEGWSILSTKLISN